MTKERVTAAGGPLMLASLWGVTLCLRLQRGSSMRRWGVDGQGGGVHAVGERGWRAYASLGLGRPGVAGLTRAWCVPGLIAQQGKENSGEPAGQGHHRDLFSASGSNPSRPVPQLGRARIAQPQHGHGGLDSTATEPAPSRPW